MRELYEADFDKPGIYGSGPVWANAWGVFRRALSRVCRGRRAAVDHVACFRWGGMLFFFFFKRTRPAASTRPHLTSLLVMRPFLAFRAKKPLHTGVRTGCHYLISLSVCMCDIRRFHRLRELYLADFHKLESIESGEYRLTRGTCVFARRLEVVAIAGLM